MFTWLDANEFNNHLNSLQVYGFYTRLTTVDRQATMYHVWIWLLILNWAIYNKTNLNCPFRSHLLNYVFDWMIFLPPHTALIMKMYTFIYYYFIGSDKIRKCLHLLSYILFFGSSSVNIWLPIISILHKEQ